MPIYEFECRACGSRFDRLQKLSDPDPDACPQCAAHAQIVRRLTAPSFRLAGSGWYETDFKKDGDKKRNLAGKDDGAKPADGSDEERRRRKSRSGRRFEDIGAGTGACQCAVGERQLTRRRKDGLRILLPQQSCGRLELGQFEGVFFMSIRNLVLAFVVFVAGLIPGIEAQAQPYGGGGAVDCVSRNYNYQRCPVPWDDARLARQISGSQCVRGQNWGFERRGGFIWVDRGCSATFVPIGRVRSRAGLRRRLAAGSRLGQPFPAHLREQ